VNPRRDSGRTNLRDVAELAGVSLASASRVLSASPGVSARTRLRVQHAAEQLGYEPNQVAQGLRQGRSMAIAFLMRDITVAGMVGVVRSAEQRLREEGYQLLVANSAGRPELDAENLRAMRQRRVDGLIVSPSSERDERTLAELRLASCPVVAVDRDLPDGLAQGMVGGAHAFGARTVVDHLGGRGHRRLALIAGDQAVRPARTCASGFIDACLEAGVAWRVVPGPFREQHGREAAHALLAEPEPPTALVAASSHILLGTLQALRDRGLRVPHDVSLVSTDGVPELEWFGPPVTALVPPLDGQGRAVAEMLLDLLAGRPGGRAELPQTFVVRASTAPPPGGSV
jgi:LacI family transcriptional regulator